MMPAARRLILLLPVTAAILAGLALRLWHVGSEPLWLDEAYSAYAAGKGWTFLWQVVPQYETHPPFYYSLLRLWTLIFGDHLIGLKSLGLACGIATIPAAGWAAREIGRYLDFPVERQWLFAGLAMLLVSLSPMMMEMSRQVRPYPVMILTFACQTALLFRLARTGRPAGGAYAAYLLLFALTLWLHNLGVLFGAAAGLAFLLLVLRRDWTRADWLRFIGGHFLVALLWVPALLILADQAPTWISSTWLTFGPNLLRWGVGALWAVALPAGQFAAAALLILALAGSRSAPRGWRAAGALLLLAMLPVALAVLGSVLVAPIFIPRTMTPVTIPAALLLALGAVLSGPRLRIAAFAALALLAAQMVTYDLRLRAIGSRYDWYGAARWIAARYRPGDQVLAYPNEGALPFRFAVRDLKLGIATRPIPTDMPTLDGGPGAWNPTGSRGVVSLPRPRLEAIADAPETRAVPTIWLLRLGPLAYDKDDMFVRALERSRVQVGRTVLGPIDIIGLRRKDLPPVAAAEQAKP